MPYRLDDLIKQAAQQTKLDPNMLAGLLQTESGFNPQAQSTAGAQGMAQFMPGTAAEMGVKDPYNPEHAVQGAAKYMQQLLGMYGGDLPQALQAYNYGMGNMAQGGPLPQETQQYPGKVMSAAQGGALAAAGQHPVMSPLGFELGQPGEYMPSTPAMDMSYHNAPPMRPEGPPGPNLQPDQSNIMLQLMNAARMPRGANVPPQNVHERPLADIALMQQQESGVLDPFMAAAYKSRGLQTSPGFSKPPTSPMQNQTPPRFTALGMGMQPDFGTSPQVMSVPPPPMPTTVSMGGTPLIDNQPMGPAFDDMTQENMRQLEGNEGPMGPFKRMAKFFDGMDPRAVARAAAIFAQSFTNPQGAMQSAQVAHGMNVEQQQNEMERANRIKQSEIAAGGAETDLLSKRATAISKQLTDLGLTGTEYEGTPLMDPIMFSHNKDAFEKNYDRAVGAISKHQESTVQLQREAKQMSIVSQRLAAASKHPQIKMVSGLVSKKINELMTKINDPVESAMFMGNLPQMLSTLQEVRMEMAEIEQFIAEEPENEQMIASMVNPLVEKVYKILGLPMPKNALMGTVGVPGNNTSDATSDILERFGGGADFTVEGE